MGLNPRHKVPFLLLRRVKFSGHKRIKETLFGDVLPDEETPKFKPITSEQRAQFNVCTLSFLLNFAATNLEIFHFYSASLEILVDWGGTVCSLLGFRLCLLALGFQ